MRLLLFFAAFDEVGDEVGDTDRSRDQAEERDVFVRDFAQREIEHDADQQAGDAGTQSRAFPAILGLDGIGRRLDAFLDRRQPFAVAQFRALGLLPCDVMIATIAIATPSMMLRIGIISTRYPCSISILP